MHRSIRIAGALASLALLSGCFHAHARHHGYARRGPAPVVVHAPGPPPHAPAHGYRHKLAHHGVELAYESSLGVYAVVGWNDLFFYDDHFYRQVDDGWEVSLRINGGWAVAERSRLPRHLAKRMHRKHHRKHGKKHRQHPAKHRH